MSDDGAAALIAWSSVHAMQAQMNSHRSEKQTQESNKFTMPDMPHEGACDCKWDSKPVSFFYGPTCFMRRR